MTAPYDPCTVKVSVQPGRGFFQTLARWWWLELLLLIAVPCAFGALVLANHQKRPVSYESAVLIEVAPPDGMAQGTALKTYLNTQCAIIRSSPCLQQVVEDLDLIRKWSAADASAAIEKLRPMVVVHPVEGTLLLRISARASKPSFTSDLADSLATAYMRVREKDAEKALQMAFSEIKRQIRIQEDAVREEGKLLSRMVRSDGIITAGVPGNPAPATSALERLEARLADLRDRKAALEVRIRILEKGSHEALLAEAETAEPPNTTPAALFRELTENLAELKALGTPEGGGEAGEAARNIEDYIAKLREELRQETELAKATLRGRLAGLDAELEVAAAQRAEVGDGVVNESASGRAHYADVMRRLERETSLLEHLRLTLSEREIAFKSDPPPAILREEAVPAARPVNHHPRREAAGAAFVGFVLAFVGMIPLALLLEGFSANRRMKKAAAAPKVAVTS